MISPLQYCKQVISPLQLQTIECLDHAQSRTMSPANSRFPAVSRCATRRIFVKTGLSRSSAITPSSLSGRALKARRSHSGARTRPLATSARRCVSSLIRTLLSKPCTSATTPSSREPRVWRIHDAYAEHANCFYAPTIFFPLGDATSCCPSE